MSGIPSQPARQIMALSCGDLFVTTAVNDQMLAHAYFAMQAEGTLETVYYDSVPSLQDFINEHMAGGPRIVLGGFRYAEGMDAPEMCGLAWSMNAMQLNGYRKADCGFTFFRSKKGMDSVQFGRMFLKTFFDNFAIDSLFGMTPENNKLAVRYIRRVGMSLHGPVPCLATWGGKPTGVWISHISKAEFEEREYLPSAYVLGAQN